MEAADVMATMQALEHAEPGVAEGFLLAATYLQAIRREQSPRTVLDGLFMLVPSDQSWPAVRDALQLMLEN